MGKLPKQDAITREKNLLNYPACPGDGQRCSYQLGRTGTGGARPGAATADDTLDWDCPRRGTKFRPPCPEISGVCSKISRPGQVAFEMWVVILSRSGER